MAQQLTAYEKELQRLQNEGKVMDSLEGTAHGAVRALEINPLQEGKKYKVPANPKFVVLTVRGTTREYVVVPMEDGTRFPLGALTRSAKPADGSDRVMPTGTVVEACQEYGSMTKFWKERMAGQEIVATKKTVVIVPKFDGTEGTDTSNVWQIDFAS
jgi:hypothetical protein